MKNLAQSQKTLLITLAIILIGISGAFIYRLTNYQNRSQKSTETQEIRQNETSSNSSIESEKKSSELNFPQFESPWIITDSDETIFSNKESTLYLIRGLEVVAKSTSTGDEELLFTLREKSNFDTTNLSNQKNKIAFVENNTLKVFDLETSEVTTYSDGTSLTIQDVQWSYNDSKIALKQVDPNNSTSRYAIIDISSQEFEYLGDGGDKFDWFNKSNDYAYAQKFEPVGDLLDFENVEFSYEISSSNGSTYAGNLQEFIDFKVSPSDTQLTVQSGYRTLGLTSRSIEVFNLDGLTLENTLSEEQSSGFDYITSENTIITPQSSIQFNVDSNELVRRNLQSNTRESYIILPDSFNTTFIEAVKESSLLVKQVSPRAQSIEGNNQQERVRVYILDANSQEVIFQDTFDFDNSNDFSLFGIDFKK